MHHHPDFERDQDRERREARSGRDAGRFEQRSPERVEPEEFRHSGRDRDYRDSRDSRDYGDEGYARSSHGQGQHQQYSQTYGNQGHPGSNQGYDNLGYHGGRSQLGGNQGYYGNQERYGGQSQGYGNESYYGHQDRYGGQSQLGGNQGYGNQGQFGGGPDQFGGRYGRNQQYQYGGDQERYGGQSSQAGYGGNQHNDSEQGYYGQGQSGGNERTGSMTGRDNERGRNHFRGKGPKDWTRSDERIREEVCEVLADADDIDASDITVKVDNGEVTLEGTVDSRWVKREAEEVVCRARGVKDCQNHLRVRSETTAMGKEGKEKETGGNGHTQPTNRTSSAMSSRTPSA